VQTLMLASMAAAIADATAGIGGHRDRAAQCGLQSAQGWIALGRPMRFALDFRRDRQVSPGHDGSNRRTIGEGVDS
jgi:hypothetical protein